MMIPKIISEIMQNTLTNSQDGVLISDYATDYVFRGKSFSLVDVLTIAGSTTESFVFDSTSIDRTQGDFLTVLPPMFTSTGGPVLVTIYYDTDYTGTTKMNYLNRSAISLITPKCTLKNTATGTDKGTEMVQYVIPSGHKSGGSTSDALPYILNGYKYLVEIKNEDTSEIYFGINFTWYED